MTRNNEGILLTALATLSDILYSQSSLGNNTFIFNISKYLLKRSHDSLDFKIVNASKYLEQVKNKGFK